jgi:hypothetical protein
VDKVEIGLAPIAIENGKYRIKKIYTGESSDLSSPLSGPVSILKLVIIIGCEWCSANTEKNLYSYFAKTAGRKLLSVNNTLFKGERVYSCSCQ